MTWDYDLIWKVCIKKSNNLLSDSNNNLLKRSTRKLTEFKYLQNQNYGNNIANFETQPLSLL